MTALPDTTHATILAAQSTRRSRPRSRAAGLLTYTECLFSIPRWAAHSGSLGEIHRGRHPSTHASKATPSPCAARSRELTDGRWTRREVTCDQCHREIGRRLMDPGFRLGR
jgi:hypothetical protein